MKCSCETTEGHFLVHSGSLTGSGSGKQGLASQEQMEDSEDKAENEREEESYMKVKWCGRSYPGG